MSQDEMALKLHTSRSAVSKLENDQQVLNVETLSQWAEVTGAKEIVVLFICGMDGLGMLQNLIQMAVGG